MRTGGPCMQPKLGEEETDLAVDTVQSSSPNWEHTVRLRRFNGPSTTYTGKVAD